MWSYEVTSGSVSRDGVLAGTGYSGHGEGLNNPAMEHVQNVGPLPRGRYTIGPFFDDLNHPGKGRVVAHLTPQPGTDDYGRSGFMIHGDNIEMDHSASHGCIILMREVRRAMAGSDDTELDVV